MSDADWAVKHSTSGFIFTMSKAALSWGSTKQPTIALPSCKSDIMAASEAAKEAIYLDRFVDELGYRNLNFRTSLSIDLWTTKQRLTRHITQKTMRALNT